jgi:hypothetical protein
MFAGSVQSSVCHLLEEGGGSNTVCGLRVSTYISSLPQGGRLHLLTSQPSNGRLCRHCIRIKEGESNLVQPINKPPVMKGASFS